MSDFKESGMFFVTSCLHDEIFRIEKSRLYKSAGENLSTVDFVLKHDLRNIIFIEAKSSSPNPLGKNPERFEIFIDRVSEKFIHSFNLYCAAILGRFEKRSDLTDAFMKFSHAYVTFKFLLVINKHRKDWLPPIQEALHEAFRQKMSYYKKIWRIEPAVLNDEMARKYGFIR